MRFSQKMTYLIEQIDFLEEAIIDHSHKKYLKAFDGKDTIDLLSVEGMRSSIYQHYMYYEGPLLSRYMIVIQLYSIFERYAVYFSKLLSEKEEYISIYDLNGKNNFPGIKTYYTKVINIKFEQWAQIDALRQVRNLIAHCDGYTTYSDQKNKIEKLAGHNTNLSIVSDNRLVMRKDFLKESTQTVFNFFDIVEPLAHEKDNLLDFSYGHINEFRAFDFDKKT